MTHRKDQPFDVVEKAQHYNVHPSGVECIEIVEMLCFNLGNATKYCWRSPEKGNALQDLKKAAWYFRRHLQFITSRGGDAKNAWSVYYFGDGLLFMERCRRVRDHEPEGSVLRAVMQAFLERDVQAALAAVEAEIARIQGAPA